uniref:Antifreeze protein n=1 Tax=Romanomermis culicivorax TaxID=13658 RepID=A0A915KBZ8_ROMCU
MVASYRWKEAATITAAVAMVLAPPAHFATQGPPPGIRTDSALESMNLIGEPSSPAVDAICNAIEQASRITQRAPAIAALPPTTMTSAQMLSMIAQQQPSAATTNSPTVVANGSGETLGPINDEVSIIKASPFLMTTTP